MRKILALLAVCIVTISFSNPKNSEINIWNKVSTDDLDPGRIVPLDMSQGYAFSDDAFIYIAVGEIGSDDEIVIVFPNGGYWTSPEADPFLEELQKEFDSLEDYLRSQESKEIKKK